MRIDGVNMQTIGNEFVDDVNHFAVADIGHIFLKSHAHHKHFAVENVFSGFDEFLHALLCNIRAHAVVHKTAGTDDLRMIFIFLSFVYKIIRVDPDTMSAHKARLEFQKVPFCSGCFKHIQRVDSHAAKNDRQLIHQSDVDVTLSILNDFGGFGHFNTWCTMYAGFDHKFIYFCNFFKHFGCIS
ncbi:hypothetical protein DSECCO2_642770 [anaerobic digester metagenome]